MDWFDTYPLFLWSFFWDQNLFFPLLLSRPTNNVADWFWSQGGGFSTLKFDMIDHLNGNILFILSFPVLNTVGIWKVD